MSGMYPWAMQPAMNYWEQGYVDPVQMSRGAIPEMRAGMGPSVPGTPPLMPSGGQYPLVPSNMGDMMGAVPQTSTFNAIKSGTMHNITNPEFGNFLAAAGPMVAGDFSAESIAKGGLGYLGSAAGGAAGSTLGASVGGALGSVLPGVGTALGGIAGGAVGDLFGGDSEEEKKKKKQKKMAQYQWLGDSISRFAGEVSKRGLERRSAIDSINQYLAGGNAQRAQMRPY